MKYFLNILVLALAVFSAPAFAAGKPVVKIGVTAPLTGSTGHLGEGMRDAMMLAREKLPADTKFDYEITFEDDGLEAKRTAATTNKLISVDKVDAIVSISSGTGGVVSPIAEQNKVVHFGIASAQNVADGEYNFIHWTPPAEEARVMAEELQKRGFKKVSALYLNQQGALAIREDLNKALAKTDVKVVSDQLINPGEKDFRTALAKAQAEEPDIYLVIFFSPELEILVKQMKEAGIDKPVTSIEAFAISTNPELYEGMWYVDAAEAEGSFHKAFESRFKKAPAFGSPNAFDIVNLLVQGYEKANAPAGVKPTNDSVVKALHEVKSYDGVLGKLTVDDKGAVLSPATVKVMKGGKPVLASSISETPASTEPAAQ